MTYQEALTIGSKAEGTIKCTYATLYDKNGNPLFSIQKSKPYRWTSNLYDENGVYTGIDEEHLKQFVEVAETRFGDGFLYSMELAIVEVEGNVSDSKLVPCTLLYDTYVYLANAIMASHKYPITIKEVTQLSEDGLQGKTPTTAVTYRTVGYNYKKKYKDLLKLLQLHVTKGEPFYIKPIAFDWHPTQVRDQNYSDDSAMARLREKESRLKKAKRMLFLALTSNAL